ncbi:MAG: hypothetical protein B7Y39_11765 [Bdellovibrio sp. 28-41-41]|nr:MAG: hypothetical protein B7Y39_11765 [Bdellovibrio sp. 28-41-41]
MVAEDSLTRLYTGSVFMSAKIDKQNSMQPTYIQSINLSVDKSTNTILGCSTESSVESLCLSMGGLYNPANNPSCSFTGGCTSGSIAISETDGSTRCRSLRELIGKVCPPDNYVLTNAAGTNIECKTGKRNISFPTATCWSPGNTSCTVNVNFMSALSAFDKANRNIEYIKVSMLSSIGGGGVCASGALSGSMYDNSTPYRIYGNWGKKRFEISVDANLTTGDVLLRSTAVNWGKTSSGGASVCKVSIEIQLDGP